MQIFILKFQVDMNYERNPTKFLLLLSHLYFNQHVQKKIIVLRDFVLAGRKKKQTASIVRRSPTSLQKDENVFTQRINKLRQKDRNVSSTVNPLSELMDENTVVTYRQSQKLSSLQSSTTPVSTNELFSNEVLESVKDIYEVDATVSNMEYNNNADFWRQGLQLQKLLHGNECFKEFVISKLLESASHRQKFVAHSLQKEQSISF